MSSVSEKVDRNYEEQRQFHQEVLTELRVLSDSKIQMATLREKVRFLEKITWTALGAAILAMIKLFFDLVTRNQ